MRVIVLAPIGRDKDLLCSFVDKRGLLCIAVHSVWACITEVAKGLDVLLVTEEAIRDLRAFRFVIAELVKEPEWSDLPVIALVGPDFVRRLSFQREQQLQNLNLTLIERPVRTEVMSRALSSAVRARGRQYQVRDFLAERLQTQENLWRTQKLESIGVLTGGIAHDFNNLLTGIIGNASLIQNVIGQEHQTSPYVEGVMRASERLADLTRQLLAYSGQGKFVVEPVDLTSVVEEVGALLHTVNPRIDLKFSLDRALAPVLGDRTQLEQIIMNLIINACEAIPEGRAGCVYISTKVTEIANSSFQESATQWKDYVEFSVVDDGIGMSSETRDRIFEPFYTTKFTGRGLGLSAVQGIVHAHLGSIHVDSELGRGSRFTILLPAAAAKHITTTTPSKTALITGKARILIVDDEDLVRGVAQTCLTRLGYETLIASNGKEALEVLHAIGVDNVDLIVLDWTMPTMDGPEFLTRIREQDVKIPIVFTSGYAESHVRQLFSTNPQIAAFLQKPFQIQVLGEVVDRVLGEFSPNLGPDSIRESAPSDSSGY